MNLKKHMMFAKIKMQSIKTTPAADAGKLRKFFVIQRRLYYGFD